MGSSADLGCLYLHDISSTGLGIRILGIEYKYSPVIGNVMSFLNPIIYFDVMRFIDRNWTEDIAGPFFHLNWMNLNNFNTFSLNKMIFEIGIQYLRRSMALDLLSFEAGVRFFNENQIYFLRIKFDNFLFLDLIGLAGI